MMVDNAITKVCQICGEPTRFAHFGIDSCRACADFFKRAKATGKEFGCRQGKRRCNISKSFMCRRCRFERCVQLGMANPREKNINVDNEQQPSKSTINVTVPFIVASPPSTVMCNNLNAKGTESILQRIGREHKASKDRTKMMELAARSASLREHVRVRHESEDLLLCTWSFMMDCCRMYALDYFNLASACFPEFAALSMEEKRQMLQNSAARIFLLETHRMTSTVFASEDESLMRTYMVTRTSCVDRDNLFFFIRDASMTARHGDIEKSMAYFMDRLGEIVWTLLVQSELTETEFYALFGLVVWQLDPNHELSEKLHVIADTIRLQIYSGLHRYYREELKLNDYCSRLGNLMMLDYTIQEANALKAEEMQTYNLLDMLTADVAFLQRVLQIAL